MKFKTLEDLVATLRDGSDDESKSYHFIIDQSPDPSVGLTYMGQWSGDRCQYKPLSLAEGIVAIVYELVRMQLLGISSGSYDSDLQQIELREVTDP